MYESKILLVNYIIVVAMISEIKIVAKYMLCLIMMVCWFQFMLIMRFCLSRFGKVLICVIFYSLTVTDIFMCEM